MTTEQLIELDKAISTYLDTVEEAIKLAQVGLL